MVPSCYRVPASLNQHNTVDFFGNAIETASRDDVVQLEYQAGAVDAKKNEFRCIVSADQAKANEIAQRTGIRAVRVILFFNLDSLSLMRLYMKIFKLTTWPVYCLEDICACPRTLQQIVYEGPVE